MNSRKLIALFLVFALTGSALAAQQQRLFLKQGGENEASDVTAVQQHSIFIEIVVEEREEKKQIHEFAAVVGLIKKCKQVRNAFDNAVLWFNDQFLFGDKRSSEINVTPESALGFQSNDTVVTLDGDDDVENGFVGYEGDFDTNDTDADDETPRWSGCYTPDGFAHAIGADDPFGFSHTRVNYTDTVEGQEAGAQTHEDTRYNDAPQWDSNHDVVKDLIDLDNQCQGCIFEYTGSFFVVDPNENRWIVDKYVYPVSVLGNLFTSGNGADCGEQEWKAFSTSGENDSRTSETVSPFADPRDNHDPHECTDKHEDGDDDDRENHCFNNTNTKRDCDADRSDPKSENSTIVEPLFTTHLQVNSTTGLGLADKAAYKFDDTGADDAGGDIRKGAIYPPKGTVHRSTCEAAADSPECAIEYNFLIAVDFAAFDDYGEHEDQPEYSEVEADRRGENEIDRGCSVEHGVGGADNDTEFWQGNSHPHNPTNVTSSPQHCHPTVNLDIFFYDDAPHFSSADDSPTSNPEMFDPWDENGAPIQWTDDCERAHPSENRVQGKNDSIERRTPLVCDSNADHGEFHAHDGTQTPRTGPS